MSEILGRLEKVSIRQIWASEPHDFTPWLAQQQNIDLLAESLHLDGLRVEATELKLGRFSSDIVASDSDGSVLIENQLEPTDHKHLGQVLTYLAGLKGQAKIVWISTQFLDEHRAAIDWLNANTSDQYVFFGVEIEVLRIGPSAAAPRFHVVAKPNDWSRSVVLAARAAQEIADNPTELFYQNYWLGLREQFEKTGVHGNFPKPWPRMWLPFGIGRSDFRLSAVLMRTEKRVRFELYLQQSGWGPKQAFDELIEQKSEIENDLGTPLDWQRLPDEKTASRVATYLNSDPQLQEDWPQQHQWILHQLQSFRRVFRQRVRDLGQQRPDTLEADESDTL